MKRNYGFTILTKLKQFIKMKNEKYKIVIIPTENITNILKSDKEKNLSYVPNGESFGYTNQHLYIVDNSEKYIPEYSTILRPDNVIIKRITGLAYEGYINSESYATKKIIASTDPSLGLPLIDEEFIREYVKLQGDVEIEDIEYHKSENKYFIGYIEK